MYEADIEAFKYITKAGFDPRAAASLLMKFHLQEKMNAFWKERGNKGELQRRLVTDSMIKQLSIYIPEWRAVADWTSWNRWEMVTSRLDLMEELRKTKGVMPPKVEDPRKYSRALGKRMTEFMNELSGVVREEVEITPTPVAVGRRAGSLESKLRNSTEPVVVTPRNRSLSRNRLDGEQTRSTRRSRSPSPAVHTDLQLNPVVVKPRNRSLTPQRPRSMVGEQPRSTRRSRSPSPVVHRDLIVEKEKGDNLKKESQALALSSKNSEKTLNNKKTAEDYKTANNKKIEEDLRTANNKKIEEDLMTAKKIEEDQKRDENKEAPIDNKQKHSEDGQAPRQSPAYGMTEGHRGDENPRPGSHRRRQWGSPVKLSLRGPVPTAAIVTPVQHGKEKLSPRGVPDTDAAIMTPMKLSPRGVPDTAAIVDAIVTQVQREKENDQHQETGQHGGQKEEGDKSSKTNLDELGKPDKNGVTPHDVKKMIFKKKMIHEALQRKFSTERKEEGDTPKKESQGLALSAKNSEKTLNNKKTAEDYKTAYNKKIEEDLRTANNKKIEEDLMTAKKIEEDQKRDENKEEGYKSSKTNLDELGKPDKNGMTSLSVKKMVYKRKMIHEALQRKDSTLKEDRDTSPKVNAENVDKDGRTVPSVPPSVRRPMNGKRPAASVLQRNGNAVQEEFTTPTGGRSISGTYLDTIEEMSL